MIYNINNEIREQDGDFMAADLHCHTKMSDGSTGIDELIYIAKKKGISTISVTDHDTFAGSIRAKIFGKRHSVEVISGAELSAYDYKRGRKAHILCYLCDNTTRLEGLFKRTAESRKRAAAIMLRKVMTMYPISPEMVSRRAKGSTNIFKQHIMHALMDAGYTESIYGSLFNKLFNPRFGLAYTEVEYPDVYDVVDQIHEAGGVAVLAHPSVYDSFDLLEDLIEYGIDGVEVWHTRNKEGDEEKLQKIARNNNLVMTGGTDFHGMYSSVFSPLGKCTTPDSQVLALKKRKEKLLKTLA